MTISNTIRKAGPFAGNGITTVFPFTFAIFDKTDVKCVLVNANGTSSTLTLDSDFSVSVNTDQTGAPGGSITYPISGNPMPTGYQLVALGDLSYEQPTSITNSGGFYPKIVEQMSDRSTIQIQQLEEIASRAIVMNESEGAAPSLPTPAGRANMIVGFDAAGNLVVLPLPASIGAGDLRDELGSDGQRGFLAGTDFVAGTTTVFNLSRAPGSTANVWAWWDGAPQFGFNLNGNVLTFKAPPPVGITRVYIRTGTSLSAFVPAQSSVVKASIAPGVIDGSKLDVSGAGAFQPAISLAYNPSGFSAWANSPNTPGNNLNGISVDIGSYGPRSFSGFPNVSAIEGAINIPSTSVGLANMTGVSGYAKNASANSPGVAIYGQADCEATNALVWGFNSRSIDNGFKSTIWGAEIDINLSNAASAAFGVNVVGGSTVEPTQGTYGLWVGPLGTFASPPKRWVKGLFVDDGAAITGVEIGAASVAGTASGSQSLDMFFQPNAFGRALGGRIQLDAGGNFNLCQVQTGSELNLIAGGAPGVGSILFTAQKSGSTPALSFYGQTPASKQTITGVKGSAAWAASLMNALSAIGLFTDSTT
ncbi:hypothetical protein B0G81_6236 [Paraburkholderia sp. BL6665CI2N2]|uniref:hypothetical protein n=1 Tax=Paraburkholderia sp. BL6665CI2N2 TaxID=1938806 RepID=UPI0010663E44|nr:hypothetical protein [Paraburkholderia sp. BL6665CI2N2]TDY25753.1 hypothetical protein B0G81_6236 [Paraburkholderia sp. BL6665CI2N2]